MLYIVNILINDLNWSVDALEEINNKNIQNNPKEVKIYIKKAIKTDNITTLESLIKTLKL